jgi:hypothetical protein
MNGADRDPDHEQRDDDARAEDAFFSDVNEILEGERTLWRAAGRVAAMAAPTVDKICLAVPLTGGTSVDLVSRAVVRRAHDALTAITVTVRSSAQGSARAHLRAMAEDLIFLKWLAELDEAVAAAYVQRSTRVEALRAVVAQQQFLPVAYQQLGTNVPDLGFPDATDALVRARKQLADFVESQGWGRRGPSVRSMAETAGLLPIYDFFYFLSSKTVHANLHEIVRLAWGSNSAVNISSEPFAGVHADLAIIYGAWLFDHIMTVVESRFEQVQQLLATREYGVWLALILVGPARNGRLPLLIYPEEFKWKRIRGVEPATTTPATPQNKSEG